MSRARGRRLRRTIAALLVLAPLALAAAETTPRPDPRRARVQATLAFACKWWTQAQMEGLDPDAPPPKEAEVRIRRWEYSDPVGVPHPDVVDVLLSVRNGGARPLPRVRVELVAEWKVGPLREPRRAVWTDRTVLPASPALSLEPGGTGAVRVPIDLKARMDALHAQERWPHRLRVTATLREGIGAAALARAVAELPIVAGD